MFIFGERFDSLKSKQSNEKGMLFEPDFLRDPSKYTTRKMPNNYVYYGHKAIEADFDAKVEEFEKLGDSSVLSGPITYSEIPQEDVRDYIVTHAKSLYGYFRVKPEVVARLVSKSHDKSLLSKEINSAVFSNRVLKGTVVGYSSFAECVDLVLGRDGFVDGEDRVVLSLRDILSVSGVSTNFINKVIKYDINYDNPLYMTMWMDRSGDTVTAGRVPYLLSKSDSLYITKSKLNALIPPMFGRKIRSLSFPLHLGLNIDTLVRCNIQDNPLTVDDIEFIGFVSSEDDREKLEFLTSYDNCKAYMYLYCFMFQNYLLYTIIKSVNGSVIPECPCLLSYVKCPDRVEDKDGVYVRLRDEGADILKEASAYYDVKYLS